MKRIENMIRNIRYEEKRFFCDNCIDGKVADKNGDPQDCPACLGSGYFEDEVPV